MRRLATERKQAVVIAIHDLTLAVQYCDCLALLAAGGIFACGIPQLVLTSENLMSVFGGAGQLYNEPSGQWAVSAR